MVKTALEIHLIKYKLSDAIKKLQLTIDIESTALSTKRLYEGPIIDIKSPKDTELIHERFEIDTETKESFLTLTLRFMETIGGSGLWKKVQIYMFVEDLIRKSSKIIINFEKCRVKLDYQIKTEFKSDIPEYEKCESKLRPEEVPDYIAQIKLFQEFTKKITALRRIKNDVSDFMAEKNMKRDIKLLSAILFAIAFPPLAILVAVIFMLFSSKRYDMRIVIVKKFMRYFADYEDGMTEAKKNMYYIKVQQTMMINLSDTLKQIFYDKNRVLMYFVFRYAIIGGLLGLLFIYYFCNPRILMMIGYTGAFVAKYAEELKSKFPILKKNDSLDKKVKNWVAKLKMIKEKVLCSKPQKLYKLCFTYENQRWYMGKGYIGKTLFFGKFIRKV